MIQIHDMDTVIFVGDSVTDCGRSRPDGVDNLGNGYPRMFAAKFAAENPDLRVRFINKGCGGEQSRHVLARLEEDVIRYRPNVVTLCIGVNDVWRAFDESQIPSSQVSITDYEANLREIISRVLAVTQNFVLMTPYMIDANRHEPMRAMMDRYGAVCKKLAAEYGVELINLQALFDELLAKRQGYTFSGDRIHPSQPGHAAITLEMMKVLGR